MRALLFILCIALTACASKPRIGVSGGMSQRELAVSTLVARVKTALLNDAVVGARRIDVIVEGTSVRLVGRVASAAERDRAIEIATKVDGVSAVTSSLDIRP